MAKSMSSKLMHKELATALNVLLPHVASQTQLQAIIQALHTKQLPAKNPAKMVLDFVDVLLDELPEIQACEPYDKRLKSLCQYCLNVIKAPEEAQPVASARMRHS